MRCSPKWVAGLAVALSLFATTSPQPSAATDVAATATATAKAIRSPKTVSIVSGDHQSVAVSPAPAGTAIFAPLVVRLVDASGKAVGGYPIRFTETTTSPSLVQYCRWVNRNVYNQGDNQPMTDFNGLASARPECSLTGRNLRGMASKAPGKIPVNVAAVLACSGPGCVQGNWGVTFHLEVLPK